MRRAIALAKRAAGRTRPNPPVGAVVLDRSGCLAGEGYHRRAGTAHAEVIALRRAGDRARGGTLFVTLEPCCTHGRTPPCTDAVLASGVKRVVVATRDPNARHRGRGLAILRRAGLTVDEGVCREAAEALIATFAKWIVTRRPFLTLKLGMTADGRIADGLGRSQWITGEVSRARVQRLRREADAVMVGASTVCRDDPSLLCRLPGGGEAYRVVVDSHGRTPPGRRVFRDGEAARTIVATTCRCPATRRKAYASGGAQVWVLPAAGGRVSLPALMRRLGALGLLHVLCEGGGELAASLVAGGLVDRYVLFVAPRLMGGGAVPAIAGAGWPLARAPRLEFVRLARSGADVLIEARPAGMRE